MTKCDLAASIACALGGARRLANGGRLARCCCHDDHDPSLSLREGARGQLLVNCFAGCDPRHVLAELRRRGLLDDRQRDWKPRPLDGVIAPKPPPDQDRLRWLLERLLPIDGTMVVTYLDSRGLDLPPPGHHLRYLPAKPPKYVWPCMVGIVTDFADASRIMSLHFTRLRPDGHGKAPLPKNDQRSLLSGFPIKGGVIRLGDDADVTLRLGVAEGIETSLAVTTAFRRDEGRFEPVWAALSGGNMAELAVIDGIETLVVYADRGQTGEAAADKLAQRWLESGREVFVAVAPLDDWNPGVVS